MSSQPEFWTLGVEEEYQIIDPATRALCNDANLILSSLQTSSTIQADSEIQQSQIEISTPICHTLSEIRSALQEARQGVIRAAHRAGRQIVASGTHPFSPWNEQQLTNSDRYNHLLQIYQQLAREQVIFGYHVHVGCPDQECAVQILNRARLWLAPLLALAANSPFWHSEQTGYDSYRTAVWWRWPTAGPPEHFASSDDYKTQIQTFIDSGTIKDSSFLYWDIRLSNRYPTMEFRVTDVCLSIDDAVMITGLVHALARTCHRHALEQRPYPTVSSNLLRASLWQAARYGLNANLADLSISRSFPAHELIERLLDMLRPALIESNDWDEVSHLVRQTLHRGNGAMRQRAIYEQTGSLQAVVDFAAQETARV